ncbi:LLM class flavin-dependent oxidoreductase [Rhodococcus ruber]|uniref:LLM class flavin-dependent oxidoreductase n=1 Tax=Rhodococcus ruber TaxID=1830 RepID=A0ABT4MFI8_9NOCA|nr:LLM class flavin-dependent oxidoreductase [Rhodococcus ruber]MCZ4519469.1 LLM class flavin-dependent oxidoreductase [Rhodococcus ruber]
MKFVLSHIPQIPGDKEKLAPIGRNTEAYQKMLAEVQALVLRADELGFYGYGTAEHHFHTEGYEVNSQPMMLYTKLATLTRNIKFIPLSLVPVSTNPLYVAEQAAMFDQMFPGRIEVALARGYQARWMQTMAQQENVTSGMPGSESDTRNREIYTEYVEVIKLAWTEDAFNYNGKHIQVPFPYEGIKNYGGAAIARRYGSPGEVNDDDTIAKIGVVPAPYSRPYPQLWLPFTLNPQTLVNAAAEGYNMLISNSDPSKFQDFLELFQKTAAGVGRDVELGENVCPVREVIVGDSYDEAFDIAVRGPGQVFYDYFQNFGFMENWRRPEDDPANFPLMFDSPEALAKRWVDTKFILCGTPSDVAEQVDDLRTGHGIGANVSHLAYQQAGQGSLPPEVTMRQLERVSQEVFAKFM